MTDRQAELLANFATAAGELATEGLNGLEPEKREAVAAALNTGAAHVRLIVVMSPFIVIGSLHSPVDRSVPPVVLFRLGDPGPQDGDFH